MFGSARCLVMAQTQFSLIKNKNKDWTSRTLANTLPYYIRYHLIFALTPTPPPPASPSTLKVDVICGKLKVNKGKL